MKKKQMKIKVEDKEGNYKIISGDKAIRIAKKIINTYIVLDCFEAGISVEYNDLKFTKIIVNF